MLITYSYRGGDFLRERNREQKPISDIKGNTVAKWHPLPHVARNTKEFLGKCKEKAVISLEVSATIGNGGVLWPLTLRVSLISFQSFLTKWISKM